MQLFYPDFSDRSCKPCDPICRECWGKSENECLSCFKPLFFLESDSSCRASCPSGTLSYENQGVCVEVCPKNFFKLTSSSICSEICSQPQSFPDSSTRSCQKCSQTCFSCYGPLAENCLECTANLLFKAYTCVKDCGEGFYFDIERKECLKCPEGCLICSNPRNCVKCLQSNSKTYFLEERVSSNRIERLCLSKCSSGYTLWADNICRICLSEPCFKCHETCLTCNGELFHNCLSCKSPFFLYESSCQAQCGPSFFKSQLDDGANLCVPCAEKGFYGDPIDGFCKTCPQGCLECSYEKCHLCEDSYLLYLGTCFRKGFGQLNFFFKF